MEIIKSDNQYDLNYILNEWTNNDKNKTPLIVDAADINENV